MEALLRHVAIEVVWTLLCDARASSYWESRHKVVSSEYQGVVTSMSAQRLVYEPSDWRRAAAVAESPMNGDPDEIDLEP